MAKLTIIDVFNESQEASVICESCNEQYIWSIINREPDFCPMCGVEIDAASFTNPEKISAA